MNTSATSDLSDFYRFLGEKVNNGAAALSPEEALDEWRRLHPDPALVDEDVAALQEAIDDIDAGEQGILFEDFDQTFRSRHKLPPQP